MTSLKKSGLLRTYYRDRLRGYRLGACLLYTSLGGELNKEVLP